MVGALDRLLSLVVPPSCWSCAAPARAGDPLCASCRRSVRRLGPELVCVGGVEAWAPLAYEGPARALVQALKYRGAVAMAGPMAAQIVASAPPGLLDSGVTLVPVPLHPARMRSRGFNQAERLATAVAARCGLAVCDCLRRTGPATRQVGRDRAARLAARGGISLRRGQAVPGRVVLVDDVATTGATLAACAAVLRATGVRRLAAVTFARTPGR